MSDFTRIDWQALRAARGKMRTVIVQLEEGKHQQEPDWKDLAIQAFYVLRNVEPRTDDVRVMLDELTAALQRVGLASAPPTALDREATGPQTEPDRAESVNENPGPVPESREEDG